MNRLLSTVAVLGAFAGAVGAQSEAFQFNNAGDQITVDRQSHWRNWVYQNNLVREVQSPMDSTGLFDFTVVGLKPKYFPATQNYVLDRANFSYVDNVRFRGLNQSVEGQIQALSNEGDAGIVGDGDPLSYWQPADADFSSDGLRNWQLLIDLGRVVFTDSIVVQFPPVTSGGQKVVPVVPASALSLADLTPELQAAVGAFSRQTALSDVTARADLLDSEGAVVVASGDVVVAAGSSMPGMLPGIRRLNDLGVSFVEVEGSDDLGDAPKLFAVEVSMGKQAGDTSSKNYKFDVVGRAFVSGNQRRFVFDLEPLDAADANLDGSPDFPGTFVHFVRITILDSDFDTKELLGEGEAGETLYGELPSERRGLRVFQRLTAGGFVKRINPVMDDAGDTLQTAEQVYGGLGVEEQGPIRYFKRELPRISEVEVWGPGTNVAYRPQRHGGAGYEDGGNGTPLLAVDGVYLSKWFGNAWDLKYSSGYAGHDQLVCCTMWLDLGATFWIDRIMLGMVTTRETSTEGSIFGWHLQGSDGTVLRALDLQTPEDFPQLENGLAWTDLVSEIYKDNNTSRVRMMQESFELRKLRFFQQRNDDPTGTKSGAYSAPGHFNELQMFGRGYPAEISFTSPEIVMLPGVSSAEAINVRERRVLSEIHWEADAIIREVDEVTGQVTERAEPLSEHPEVDLQIQTRSSDTIDSLFTYYTVTGRGTAGEKNFEIDFSEYDGILDLWILYNAWDALPAKETFTLRAHSDGDDDGDSLINEDPIDGIDNDGDRRIDEDGMAGDIGGPQQIRGPGVVSITKHARKVDDDGDGAEDEDPIDGIDNDGDLLIDEDGKKVAKPRQDPRELITPFFAGWSAWSEPYSPTRGENRASITSPSPRKFLQVRISILSEDPDVTARVRSLRVDLAPPISTDLAGELALLTDAGMERPITDLIPTRLDYDPPRGVEPLRQTPYVFFVRAAGPDPNAAAASGGFDEILLLTPSRAQPTGVRIGRVSVEDPAGSSSAADRRAVTTTFERAYLPLTGDTLFADALGNQLIVRSTVDSFQVLFPAAVNTGFSEGENVLIELQFQTQTLKAGSEFLALVRNSEAAAIFQRVESEGRDATELVDSETARPTVLQVDSIIDEISIPSIFSPNGDGVNDQLDIEFTVLTIRDDRPVEVAIYDLSGRRVGTATSANGLDQAQSGTLGFSWDGTAESGDLVPPGIYIARVKLETDSEDIEVVQIVNVVY
jgi:hypothetical protein